MPQTLLNKYELNYTWVSDTYPKLVEVISLDPIGELGPLAASLRQREKPSVKDLGYNVLTVRPEPV